MSENEAERPRETNAQRQKRLTDSFLSSMEKRRDQIGALLGASKIDPDFFVAVGRRALAKSPDLINCDFGSLMQAFINAATDGLLPDGREGVVNAYKGIATFQPMYMGLMKVAYRTGLFLSIEARVVYEGEFFEFEMGDDPFIKHRPNAAGTANRNIVAAYMVAKTTNGGVFREVMLKPDLDKVAAVSRAKSGPNKDWPEEMARKAAVRRGWKYLPHTPEMSQVVEHDDANYDLGALDDAPPPPKRINAGFATPQAQAQLTQGADPTMDLSAGLDEALDGDQIPVGGGMSDEEADERAEVSQQLEEQAHLPDINDLPADDDFPGDRPGVKTETSSKPDPLAWARDFTASLPTFLTVRLVNDAWAKAKASGLVAALQAKNLDLFNQLVSLRDDRIDQLQNGLQK